MLYKVVFNDGKISSAATYGSLKVIYRPGEWSEAPVGGILVFDNLLDAERFLAILTEDPSFNYIYNSHSSRYYVPMIQVWESEVEGPVSLPVRRLRAGLTLRSAERLWSGDKTLLNDPNMDLDNWPKGTKAYKRCKLVRMVRDSRMY